MHFALVYDGWTARSHHFLGTFATFNQESVLLGFTEMDMEEDEEEPTFDALKFMNLIESQLKFYGRSLESIICVTGRE